MKGLPKWLTPSKGGYVIDPDIAYPAILDALGVDAKDVDQYWLEVAYQVAKLHAQESVLKAGHDPATTILLFVRSDAKRKERWGLAGRKPGRGITLATKAGEAKGHYNLIRHRLEAGR
jgi:hypothetical protein